MYHIASVEGVFTAIPSICPICIQKINPLFMRIKVWFVQRTVVVLLFIKYASVK